MTTSTSHADVPPLRRLLPKDVVCGLTSLSFSSLKRLEEEGRFPARVRVSAQKIGYYEHEVREWIATRQRAVDAPLSGYSADPEEARVKKAEKAAERRAASLIARV